MSPTSQPTELIQGTKFRSLVFLFAGNLLFAAGLIVHAFLFNFYLRELQLSASVMGHQVAAMTIGGLCVLLPAGMVIDRLGIRAALLGGVSVAFAGLTLTAIARSPPSIYSAAFLIGVGAAACRVAWGPAIMRLTSEAARARAFTWNVALLIASGAGWTLLAGELPAWTSGVASRIGLTATQCALLGTAAITACAAICYAPLRLPRPTSVTRLPLIALPPEVRAVVPLVAFWMLAAALVLPFFNIYFADRFGMPVARVGAVFAAASIGTAVVLLLTAELARRWGARRSLVALMFVLAPALLCLSVTDVLPVAIVTYFVQGVIAPATNPLIDQLLLERTSLERHGIVASWRNAAAEASGAFGASAGGKILDAGSYGMLFLTASAVAALSAALLAAALRPRASSRLAHDLGAT